MRKFIASVAAAAMGALAVGSDAAADSAPVRLADFAGMWEVVPRGPGPGSPPPGDGRSPPGGGVRPPGAGLGPPPEQDTADDLPGPAIEGLDRGDKMTYAIMTAAGRAAFERMNPRDLPSNNCKSNGLPSLVGIPDLQEWSFSGDRLTIRYADFNTVRTIHLGARPAAEPPSLYGQSAGAFADGELVVTTTGLIATPGGLGRNAPGSAARSYVEHYRLSADGAQVTGYLTIHDPEFLTRDLTIPISFQRPENGAAVPDEIPCDAEASQRYLD